MNFRVLYVLVISGAFTMPVSAMHQIATPTETLSIGLMKLGSGCEIEEHAGHSPEDVYALGTRSGFTLIDCYMNDAKKTDCGCAYLPRKKEKELIKHFYDSVYGEILCFHEPLKSIAMNRAIIKALQRNNILFDGKFIARLNKALKFERTDKNSPYEKKKLIRGALMTALIVFPNRCKHTSA